VWIAVVASTVVFAEPAGGAEGSIIGGDSKLDHDGAGGSIFEGVFFGGRPFVGF
jgi:hypothetical protein